MKLKVDHLTCYRYDAPVRLSTQYLRLFPHGNAQQRILDWRLDTPGNPVRTLDGFGNVLHVLTLDTPTHEIAIRARGTVETGAASEDDKGPSSLSPLIFTRVTPLTRVDEALAAFAERFRRRASGLSGLREFASAVSRAMPFQPGEQGSGLGAPEAFAKASGASPDQAQVFVAGCRYLGVPARYVSGYAYVPVHTGPLVGSHAWAEAWVVDRWRSFDIAYERPAGEDHIKLAIGADSLDASPIRGVRVGGGSESMTAQARVQQAVEQ